MSFERPALTGLDDIDWAALEHAYGPAEDVPDLLRQLTGGDQEAAQDAMYELWGTVWHQGSVYPATVAAVPYLAAIAVSGSSGVPTAEVLALLGSIAESTDPRGLRDPEAVRAAVTACVEVIVPLAGSADSQTRAAALFALVHSAPAERVRALLLEHWRTETEPALLSAVLHGLMRIDATAAADRAGEVLGAVDTGSIDAVLRVSAAIAWLRAGRALDANVIGAAVSPLPDDTGLSLWPLMHDPFESILGAVVEHHGVRAALDLVAATLDADNAGSADLVGQRLAAAEALIAGYRSAAAVLAEPIARWLSTRELTARVIGTLERIGPGASGPAVREHLVAIACGELDVTTETDSGTADFADEALACLARWADPIVPGLLARDLPGRPRTLEVVAEPGSGPGRTSWPFDAALLDAIIARLTTAVGTPDAAEPFADNPIQAALFGGRGRKDTSGERALVRILCAWGPPAAPAVGVLIRMLAANPAPAADALAAIGIPNEEAVASLRRIAGDSHGAARTRITAAKAIRALTGETHLLLEMVIELLAESPITRGAAAYEALQPAAEAAAELPDHAATLTPHLIAALHSVPMPTPALVAHEIRISLARTLWRFSTDAEPLLSVLSDTLALAGEFATGSTVARAAEAAADLGPTARPLLPALETALTDPLSCPAAARALLDIDPDSAWTTINREQLVERLIDALIESRTAHGRNGILDRLTELAPHPTKCAERLRDLADRDERLVTASFDSRIVEADEQARTRIRDLLAR
ncbi:hypothetical protein [Nocardia sp. NBC_00511]|uniref:hypothetical protein n=1 Tax=Nocardia sp. NBC_00511 TaxID=2903591 RepID=UPI0030E1E75A